MTRRGVALAALGVLVLAVAGVGGLYWQGARDRAAALAEVQRSVDAELGRETPDRATLVELVRRIDQLAATQPAKDLIRLQVRIALALQLPEDATAGAERLLLGAGTTADDRVLAARAYALRHALRGSQDDARQAAGQGLLALEAGAGPEAGLLSWQSATRIDDRARVEAAAEALRARFPDSWEARVVAALTAFDPEQPATGDAVRRLRSEGHGLPELDLAVATMDLMSSDDTVRLLAFEEVKRVLGAVPAFKAARLVAVFAFDRAGDPAARDAHLNWLLTNYPGDARADQWRGILTR